MTNEEIEEYRRILVMSYQCNDTDIKFDFEKIVDVNDEDRDDCLWLVYKYTCIWYGKLVDREIARLKLPLPEEIRIAAEKILRENRAKQRAAVPALPEPSRPIPPRVRPPRRKPAAQ